MTDNAFGEAVRSWLAHRIEAIEGEGHRVRTRLIRQPEIGRSEAHLLVQHHAGLHAFGSGCAGCDGLVGTAHWTCLRFTKTNFRPDWLYHAMVTLEAAARPTMAG